MKKLLLVLVPFLLIAVWVFLVEPEPAAPLPTVTTYKDPLCGCCSRWVEHMRSNGWQVEVKMVAEHFNVPQHLRSCHTSVITGYIFEGHIPTDYIESFLRQPPAGARGLAVPGMPLESPGMETPSRKDEPRYEIYSFTDAGTVTHYATVYRRPA